MRIADLAGLRVAVWGYGREGQAALAALERRLPQARTALLCSANEADHARAAHPRAEVHAGTPDAATLAAFDVVVKSPGISAYTPALLDARQRGTRFTSGTALWFAENPDARVIAVTGTKGKSTVTALIAHLLRALGRRTALAGNIGLPLLELLDATPSPDWWAIELSSFQTADARNVAVGVVNNVYEEHLDWHGSRERYVADKLALARVSRQLVAWREHEAIIAPARGGDTRVQTFGDAADWHVAEGAIQRGDHRVFDLGRSPLAGPHNALNLCAALAALEAAGEDACAAAPAIASFRPLPHRLQKLGERDRISYVDDSIATTPQATLEALASFRDRPVVVLVGGFERGLDWRPFADAVRDRAALCIVTTGANGPRIAATLREAGGRFRLESTASLAEAMDVANACAVPGSVVLLSPGAPSFDQFVDYAERGRAFAARAGFDPAAIGMIEGLGIA